MNTRHRFSWCVVALYAATSVVAVGAAAQQVSAPESVRLERAQAAQSAIGLGGLLLDYGMPASPAFALLPDKPSQVAQLTTPKDVAARFSQWFDGTHLVAGSAFEARPFAGLAGSLEQYQRSDLLHTLWRTVLSAGTAKKGASDVIAAVGLRFPLLDAGDPRAKPEYVDSLTDTYLALLDVPPPLNATAAQMQARFDAASKAVETFRKSHLRSWWNATRVDVGTAISFNAHSVASGPDRMSFDRAGLWAAASGRMPRIRSVAWAGLASASWSRAAQDTLESARYVGGASVRWFPADWFAASLEGARNLARFRASARDDAWWHWAVGVELKLPFLPGWLGLAYGGDLGRQGTRDPAFNLAYGLYQDRRMKP